MPKGCGRVDKAELGKRIAEQRRKLGLTQKELARQLHVTDKAVSKWERGLSYPDITLLPPLADCLALPVSSLLSEAPSEAAGQVAETVLDLSRDSIRRSKLRAFFQGTLLPVLLAMCTLFLWVRGFRQRVDSAALYFAEPSFLAEVAEGPHTSVTENCNGGERLHVQESRLCGRSTLGTVRTAPDGSLIVKTRSKRGMAKLLLLDAGGDPVCCVPLDREEIPLSLSPGGYEAVLVGYWFSGQVTLEGGG